MMTARPRLNLQSLALTTLLSVLCWSHCVAAPQHRNSPLGFIRHGQDVSRLHASSVQGHSNGVQSETESHSRGTHSETESHSNGVQRETESHSRGTHRETESHSNGIQSETESHSRGTHRETESHSNGIQSETESHSRGTHSETDSRLFSTMEVESLTVRPAHYSQQTVEENIQLQLDARAAQYDIKARDSTPLWSVTPSNAVESGYLVGVQLAKQDHGYLAPQQVSQDQSYLAPQQASQDQSYLAPQQASQDQSYLTPQASQDQSYLAPQQASQDQSYLAPQEASQDQSYLAPQQASQYQGYLAPQQTWQGKGYLAKQQSAADWTSLRESDSDYHQEESVEVEYEPSSMRDMSPASKQRVNGQLSSPQAAAGEGETTTDVSTVIRDVSATTSDALDVQLVGANPASPARASTSDTVLGHPEPQEAAHKLSASQFSQGELEEDSAPAPRDTGSSEAVFAAFRPSRPLSRLASDINRAELEDMLETFVGSFLDYISNFRERSADSGGSGGGEVASTRRRKHVHPGMTAGDFKDSRSQSTANYDPASRPSDSRDVRLVSKARETALQNAASPQEQHLTRHLDTADSGSRDPSGVPLSHRAEHDTESRD